MTPRPDRGWYWIDLIPFGAALLMHGAAHGRVPQAVVAALLLILMVHRQIFLPRSTRRLVLMGALGLLVGLGSLALNQPPAGPIPPVILSGITGMLIALGIEFAATRRSLALGITGWSLVVVSGNVRMTALLQEAQLAFIVLSLLCGAIQAGVLRAVWAPGGWKALPVAGLFVAFISFGTHRMEKQIRALEEPVLALLQSLLADPQRQQSSSATRDISITARSSITLSPQPILDLSRQPERLRTQVMDSFDGIRWTSSNDIRLGSRRLDTLTRDPRVEKRLDLILLDDSLDRIPAPAGTWATRGFPARVDGGWIIFSRQPTFEATLLGSDEEQLPEESPPSAELTSLPADLRRALQPLADEVLVDLVDPRTQAEQLERFFHDRFTYSLETDLGGSDPPLVIFVRERRPAYCIYFASAYAALLRARDIPTRLVGGYLAESANPLTGRVIVRERDAHAWTEVWIEPEHRWVAFDPTPSRSRQDVTGQGETPGFPSALADAVTGLFRRGWLAFRRRPLQIMLQFVALPAMLLLAVLAVLGWRRRTRGVALRRGPSWRLRSEDPLLARAYRKYQLSLRRAGIVPRDSETDDEVLQRLADSCGVESARAGAEFLALYRRSRYRGEPADKSLLTAARFT